MYVVRFILIFTFHLETEQLIPYCGENEFYYKYIIDLEKVNVLSYYYIMKALLSLYLVFIFLFIGGISICLLFLDYYPHSKISDFIRRHIIDEMDDQE